MIKNVFTLGVYGKTEDEFFEKMVNAGINVFCDIRRRRGVRGSQHAFVNSAYLQKAVGEHGLEYRYVPELAPSQEIRETQRLVDAQQGISKRKREELGEEFKTRYIEEILNRFDLAEFNRSFGPAASSIVLFCVEANPSACHRSLVADRIRAELGVPVTDL